MTEKYIDIEFDDYEDEEVETLEIDRYDISFFPADYTLSTVFDALEKNQILFPEFQREYVWDSSKVRQSRLIESFLLGLPVPQVFLQKRVEDNKLFVVDGLQRLTTIKRFYKDELTLSGIQQRWVNKKYSDLSDEDKDHLDNQPIRAIIIRQMTPKEDNSSMFYIFERLNTGGMILRPMEIRKAVYWGDFYKVLNDLNEEDCWRRILGSENIDRRLRDVEWILRIFSLRYFFPDYPGTMKEFLNKAMYRFHHKKVDYSDFAEDFKKLCEYVLIELGEKPFHKPKGRLNISILDVVMATLLSKGQVPSIKEKYAELLSDKIFLKTLEAKDTARTEILKERFSLASKYLK